MYFREVNGSDFKDGVKLLTKGDAEFVADALNKANKFNGSAVEYVATNYRGQNGGYDGGVLKLAGRRSQMVARGYCEQIAARRPMVTQAESFD